MVVAKREKMHSVRGRSPRGKASFVKVFQPEAMEEGKKPKYQITISFVPENLNDEDKECFRSMIAAAEECSKDHFGSTYREPVDIDGEKVMVRSPFRPGKTNRHYEDDEVWIRFSSFDKPEVVDGFKQEITEESGAAYSGMLARVSWCCQAYDHMGNRGITFYLNNVQKTGAGERITGGSSASSDFDEVEAEKMTSGGSASDPAAPDELSF